MKLMSHNEDAFFEINFEVFPVDLTDAGDEEYSCGIRGNITRTPATPDNDHDEDREEKIGTIHATLFRTRDAFNNGEPSLYDIFDALSEDSETLYHAVFGTDEDGEEGVTGAVRDTLPECYGWNVLGIDRVGVEPEYRGKGIAEAAVKRLCQIFGSGAIVAVQSFPLAYEADAFSNLDPAGGTDEDKARGLRFWQKIGFVVSPNPLGRKKQLLIADGDHIGMAHHEPSNNVVELPAPVIH
ncbi:MAG: GNAT family N-acetyltransferase [Planctomycetota bacterium]|jgi:GNAT superfamily N-acetyltransferase